MPKTIDGARTDFPFDTNAGYEAVEAVVRARRTVKVLAESPGELADASRFDDKDSTHESSSPTKPHLKKPVVAEHRDAIRRSLRAANWAPFHFPRNVDGLAEPWRAHLLWPETTQRAARYLRDTLGCKTKEPQLLDAADACVLVTWLPELGAHAMPINREIREKLAGRDEEHLAATAAFVQNLLLLLTAGGFGTYWSSGGQLRSPEMFEHLGMTNTPPQKLLAAVFIETDAGTTDPGGRRRVPGKHRDCRDVDRHRWLREVTNR
ncbi:MAG: nitroreductase family protein [Planctomycetota bacterium]